MLKNMLKRFAWNFLLLVLVVVISGGAVGLTSWAQTTETTRFSYDDAKQLIKAVF